MEILHQLSNNSLSFMVEMWFVVISTFWKNLGDGIGKNQTIPISWGFCVGGFGRIICTRPNRTVGLMNGYFHFPVYPKNMEGIPAWNCTTKKQMKVSMRCSRSTTMQYWRSLPNDNIFSHMENGKNTGEKSRNWKGLLNLYFFGLEYELISRGVYWSGRNQFGSNPNFTKFCTKMLDPDQTKLKNPWTGPRPQWLNQIVISHILLLGKRSYITLIFSKNN